MNNFIDGEVLIDRIEKGVQSLMSKPTLHDDDVLVIQTLNIVIQDIENMMGRFSQ